MSGIKFQISVPQTPEELEQYYLLRWLVLRKPWRQPPGSEKDDLEKTSFHVMAVFDGRIIGVGRLHPVAPGIFQVRYMAVDENCRGSGVGTALIEALEKQALLLGAKKIVLDARRNAVGFYQKKGYSVTGPSHTLFGSIVHFKMEKTIGK